MPACQIDAEAWRGQIPFSGDPAEFLPLINELRRFWNSPLYEVFAVKYCFLPCVAMCRAEENNIIIPAHLPVEMV